MSQKNFGLKKIWVEEKFWVLKKIWNLKKGDVYIRDGEAFLATIFFIFHRRVLIFLYCGRNGCFFDMLELQVAKPPGEPSLKMAKYGQFGTENGHF